MAVPPLFIFEDGLCERLYPLTYSRPASELRVGTLTLRERLQLRLPQPAAGLLCRDSQAGVWRHTLEGAIPVNPAVSMQEGMVLLNARWLALGNGGAFDIPPADTANLQQDSIVWIHLSAELAGSIDIAALHLPRTLEAVLPRVRRLSSPATLINRPWDLFTHQRAAIEEDFARLGPANDAATFSGVHFLGAANIHLAKGVKIWPGAVLDAQGGPIIVEEAAEIRANAVITGPVVIGPHCVVRTGADIREETVLGPGSRVGGEVSASLFLGHGNKQHYGFVGQSIVGEWANLGAGTTTSNLKNTYGLVKMPLNNHDESTGRQFLGALIADHAKLGIGTYLSTGSVVGFASHVIAPRPPRFVPSFAWVTSEGVARADFEKIEQIATTAMERRGVAFTPALHELFVRIASEYARAEGFAWADE